MIGAAREHMKTQQLHQVLSHVWAVVADANRYFASEAPWALAKTDPPRQGTVLYVTAEVLRQVGILCQPFMPASAAGCSTCWPCRRTSGNSSGWARPASASRLGPHCRLRHRYFRATSSRKPRRRDTCLSTAIATWTFLTSRTSLTTWWRAPGSAGIGRMVTISTRVRRHADLLAIAERFPDVFCSVGTHPHHAHEELDIGAAELVQHARHPRVVAIGEAGLDFHYDNSPREAQEQGFRAHIAAAREPVAAGDTRPRSRRGCGEYPAKRGEKGAFPAVLHCFTGGRELAFTGIELGLYVSFTGILTFKKSDDLRAIAKDLPAERILVETDSPYLAPGKFRGKRCEPAYVVETARVLAETRGVARTRSRGRPLKISSACSARCRGHPLRLRHDVSLHHSRLRVVHGRAAAGARLGRLRPEQSEEPPAADLAFGRTPRPEWHHPGLGRYLAGPARAASGRQSGLGRWRADQPRTCRPHPRHRRPAAVVRPQAAPGGYVLTATNSALLRTRFAYCFESPPGSEYPPMVTDRRMTPGNR